MKLEQKLNLAYTYQRAIVFLILYDKKTDTKTQVQNE